MKERKKERRNEGIKRVKELNLKKEVREERKERNG